MKAKLTLLQLLLAVTALAQTSTVTVNTSTKVTQPPVGKFVLDGALNFFLTRGSGTPEGTVTATMGSLYLDQTGKLWMKASGTGNTGWVQMGTGSGSGTVTSVGLSMPNGGFVITGSPVTTSGTLTATQHVADTTHDGYLSSTDWNTFNGKQNTITPAALTRVDDTNVTLTLGGTPSTALLQATSLTLGWTGTLGISRGGTGAATSAAHTFFANNTGSSGAPSFTSFVAGTDYWDTTVFAGFSTIGLVPSPTGIPPCLRFLDENGTWSCASGGSSGGAPDDAHYLTDRAESGLSNEVNLGALTTGLLKIAVSGSVATPSTAVEGTDYLGTARIDDTAYGVGWNGDTTHAPSKNAVYDKIETIAGSGAPADATYITKVAESGLSAEFALASLATGLLKNTTTTGVPTIGVVNTDYYEPPTITGHGDSDYTILTTDYIIKNTASISTTRTWTLPLAANVPAGKQISVWDITKSLGDSTAITIATGGSDRVYPANTASFTLGTAQNGSAWTFTSDGISKWFAYCELPGSNQNAGEFVMWLAGKPGRSPYTLPTSIPSVGKILQSDGSNIVGSTPTYPTSAGSSGNVLTSDGTNWTSSTPVGGGNFTTHGDSNYTILTTDKVVVTSATLTAARIWTLPAANAVIAGTAISVFDLKGGVTAANTLDISAAGSDTFQPQNTTYCRFTTAGQGVTLVSDGTSKWSALSGISGWPTTGAAGRFPQHPTGDGYLWATSTYSLPSSIGTTNKLLRSDGTDVVFTSATFPTAGGTAGTMIQSNGTNFFNSTPTWPTGAATSGAVVVADGTNFVGEAPDVTAVSKNTGGWKEYKVSGSDFTRTAQTFANITGLVSDTLSTASNYEWEAKLYCTTTAVTTGVQITASITQTPTNFGATFVGPTTVASNIQTMDTHGINAIGIIPATYLTTSSETGMISAHGWFTTGAGASPVFSLQGLKVTSGTLTVKIGSILKIKKL